MTHSALPLPFKKALPWILFTTAIFCANFMTRTIIAPLLPALEAEFNLTHAHAVNLLLWLAFGNGIGLFLNGFTSARIGHRRTVGFSAIAVGTLASLTPVIGQTPVLFGISIFLVGLAVGLYLPSGIATVTSIARREDWGKALAIHEFAPTSAYIIAPLLLELVLCFSKWWGVFIILGITQIVIGILYLYKGRGGDSFGVVPSLTNMKKVFANPMYWVLMFFFLVGMGASMGPYTMLPLFLIDTQNFTHGEANQFLASSRVLTIFIPFLAGLATDKWGARRVIFIYGILASATTLTLGIAEGQLLLIAAFVQPLVSVIIFAPALTLLSQIFDIKMRGVAISFMGPFNAMIGIGIIPATLAHLGKAGHFDYGFIGLGCLALSVCLVIFFLPKRFM